MQLDAEGSIQYGMYYWDDNYPDSHVFAEGECLRKTFDPDFMLYHTMAVDEWGHMKGADSAEYANAVAAVGHLIAARMPEWLEKGYQVVVTADHGMNNLGQFMWTNMPRERLHSIFSAISGEWTF